MCVVDVLPHSVRLGRPGCDMQGGLRIRGAQPRRDGVRRGPDDHVDAADLGLVQDRLQPVEAKLAFPRLPGRPHRLSDPDHVEPARGHQIEVFRQPGLQMIFGVVGRTEADLVVPDHRSAGETWIDVDFRAGPCALGTLAGEHGADLV